MAINGTSVALILAGGVLAYSGVKGHSISTTVQSFLKGSNPARDPVANPITTPADGAAAAAAAIPAQSGVVTTGASPNVVTAAALSQLGKPYIWDTPLSWSNPNPKSFDCSGLTGWSYAKAGVTLTHFTGSQYAELSHKPVADVTPGDLIFYAYGGTGIPYHVVMYLGDMTIIEAPETGIPVRTRVITFEDADMMPNAGGYPNAVVR